MDQVNVEGTQNVVDILSGQQQAKLLHLSSVVTVGATFKPIVQNEDSEYLIKTTYGATTYNPMNQILKSNAINLTVGILF